jgi:hypothetical protein
VARGRSGDARRGVSRAREGRFNHRRPRRRPRKETCRARCAAGRVTISGSGSPGPVSRTRFHLSSVRSNRAERLRPQFQTRPVSHRAKKVLLKFARSSNRRIPHVERSAFKGVERGHHLASSDEFSRFFARAPIGRAGRSITQAREKKGFNPKGRLKKRLSRRARALPSAPVSARVARPERRLRRAPEDPHRPDPGETPRLERGRGTWRPRCRARCPRTRLR